MDPTMIAIIGCVFLIILLIVGIPIAFSLIAVGLFGLMAMMGVEKTMSLFMTVPYSQAASYSLTPLPLFVIMAGLAFAGGMTTGLYDAAKKWVGRLPGALGVATTLACTVFGTLSGSALVVAAMFTKISVPEMLKSGYDRSFAHGLTAASAVIGMLIPPSMVAIMYGALTNESIGKILMAGVGVGLSTTVAFSILIIIMAKRNPKIAPLLRETYSLKEKFTSLKSIVGLVVVAGVMLVGIFVGWFTVTEGAAVGVGGMLVVDAIMRKLNWKMIKWVSLDAAKTTGMVFMLLIGAAFFSRFLSISGLGNSFVTLFTESGLPESGVLAGFLVIFLVLGCFLDPMSELCIMLPLMQPVVKSFGWDPIYFAMLVLYTVHIGTITPPVGLVLFATQSSSTDPTLNFSDIIRGVIPFVVVMVILLVIFVFAPPLTVGLAAYM